jgi:O-antigen ligase
MITKNKLNNNEIILITLTAFLLFKPAPGILFGEFTVKGFLLLVLLISFSLAAYFFFTKSIKFNSYKEILKDQTILFIILSSISLLISIIIGAIKEPENGTIMNVSEFYRYGLYISFYLIARYATVDMPNKLIKSGFIIFLIIELFGLFQAFNIFNINNHIGLLYTSSESLYFMLVNQQRVPSTLLNPNLYGSFLLIIISLLFGFLSFMKPSKKTLLILLITLSFASVFLTTSRTAVITVAGLIVYWILLSLFVFRKSYKRLIIKGLSILLLFIVTAALMIPQIKYLDYAADQIISTIINSDTQKAEGETEKEIQNFEQEESNNKLKESVESVSSFKNRYYYWDLNYEKFLESPVFGSGPMKNGFVSFADNSYLYILARYGVFGLLIFLLFFGYLFYKTVKIMREGEDSFKGLLAMAINLVIVGYAVMGVVAESWFNIQSMTFLFILIGLLFNKKTKKVRGYGE